LLGRDRGRSCLGEREISGREGKVVIEGERGYCYGEKEVVVVVVEGER